MEKNVGMEGVVRSFYNYDFYLYLSASTLKMLKVLEIMHQDLFPMLKLMILPFTRVNWYDGRPVRLHCFDVDKKWREAATSNSFFL